MSQPVFLDNQRTMMVLKNWDPKAHALQLNLSVLVGPVFGPKPSTPPGQKQLPLKKSAHKNTGVVAVQKGLPKFMLAAVKSMITGLDATSLKLKTVIQRRRIEFFDTPDQAKANIITDGIELSGFELRKSGGDRPGAEKVVLYFRANCPMEADLLTWASRMFGATCFVKISSMQGDLPPATTVKQEVAEDNKDEKCHNCGVFYPTPVSLHHTNKECLKNQGKSKGAAKKASGRKKK